MEENEKYEVGQACMPQANLIDEIVFESTDRISSCMQKSSQNEALLSTTMPSIFDRMIEKTDEEKKEILELANRIADKTIRVQCEIIEMIQLLNKGEIDKYE